MRRALALSTVVALALTAAACSGSSDGAAGDTATTLTQSGSSPSSAVPNPTTDAGSSSEGVPQASEGAGSGGTPSDASTPAAGGSDASRSTPLELRAAASALGQVVVDADGRTLYVYVDGATTSCPGSCEGTWPPRRTGHRR